MAHKIVLTQKATQWIRDMLAGGEWKQNENRDKAGRDAYRSQKLLYTIIPDLADQPIVPEGPDAKTPPLPSVLRAYQVELDKWDTVVMPEWSCSDKEFEMIKRCVTWYIGAGRFLVTKQSATVITTFGVGADDE